MRRIKFTFPNGMQVSARLLDETEPELSQSLWDTLERPVRFICHNTLSSGSAFGAYMRPPREPVEAGYQGRPVGHNSVSYTKIKMGEMVWTGTRFLVVYGPCTEPGIVGAVVVKVDEADLGKYEEACNDVWYHTYHYHKLAVLTAEREAE